MATTEQVTTTVDDAFLDGWATEFLDAWNALDGRAVASLCTEDVQWSDPSTPQPLRGRDAVRGFVETTGQAFPDLHIEETAPPCCLPGCAQVLAPYRMTGTMRGHMDMFAPTGRPLSISGVDEWTFRGELLCGYRTYYDTLDAARQLGIMPASGSRAERTMARLQHIQARVRGDAVSSISMLRWQLWYAGWQHGSVDPDPDRPVFVSLTDFRIHRPWHAPSAWRSGLRLRRSWPRLEGAIGLWLWAEPVKLRSGSVSIWRTQEDLMRFLRSPVHRAIVARYRTRMSGTSSGWTAPRLDRGEIWSQAIHILTKQQTPARESNRLA